MLPCEAMAMIAADASIGVLIDRRTPHRTGSVPDDLRLVARIDLGPVSDGVVVSLVEAHDRGPLPRRDGRKSNTTHIRLLDRFFLPAVIDERVVAPMFDLIADLYDELTDLNLNMHVAILLLQEALVGASMNSKILDFGCGTGIAASAARKIGTDIRLLGVDVSTSMLRHAAKNGLTTMEVARWREECPRVDGAIASFVLHYGVDGRDLANIAESLRPGAAFVANFFGADIYAQTNIIERLVSAGLVLEKQSKIEGSKTPNLLLVFRKSL